ncbi:hypothetical protein SAMN05421743_11613 [Thalassobacillus cyri]|uniref:Uncharacterized protein n=1 Tax=Thalassobacillus cyri TaxID=571932 RepID=A0A1H4GJ96_9BACI|nr:hypothetical protein [Thalassobacillus cyri]SEB08938.1 hypothetical protein SAMN05421743_11613 [Thalassobacillus cyri]
MIIQETVIIEGYVDEMKFSKPVLLSYNPDSATPEQALISFYGSQARNFEELAIQRGWQDAYWTYPAYYEMVI